MDFLSMLMGGGGQPPGMIPPPTGSLGSIMSPVDVPGAMPGSPPPGAPPPGAQPPGAGGGNFGRKQMLGLVSPFKMFQGGQMPGPLGMLMGGGDKGEKGK